MIVIDVKRLNPLTNNKSDLFFRCLYAVNEKKKNKIKLNYWKLIRQIKKLISVIKTAIKKCIFVILFLPVQVQRQ